MGGKRRRGKMLAKAGIGDMGNGRRRGRPGKCNDRWYERKVLECKSSAGLALEGGKVLAWWKNKVIMNAPGSPMSQASPMGQAVLTPPKAAEAQSVSPTQHPLFHK